MLQLKTVEPRTFSILEELLAMPEMQPFGLVGGTALSLLYGHRMSVDLDLFSFQPFENAFIINALRTNFNTSLLIEEKQPKFGIFCYIENVKVDIIRHPHALIRPLNIVDNIRMFSTEDIIAMKVQAVLGRAKKKDFWDIAELLNHYTVSDFVQFHKEKYASQNLMITVPQAISYFEDAEDSEDPISLKNQTWDKVKSSISKHVSAFLI
jgi:predicted nucleotidyltransferase component of viral defense system